MAALRSAPRGDRVLTWRDWLTGYGAAWLLPVPLGLMMVLVSILWRWPFEALDRPIPLDGPTSYVFGLGMVVIFVPMLSWIGLVLSAPLVWGVMRAGIGGWISFALGGAACALLAAAMLDGMTPAVPVAIGVLSALAFRAILRWLRPAAFDPAPGRGPS